jgi:hypothetical protein
MKFSSTHNNLICSRNRNRNRNRNRIRPRSRHRIRHRNRHRIRQRSPVRRILGLCVTALGVIVWTGSRRQHAGDAWGNVQDKGLSLPERTGLTHNGDERLRHIVLVRLFCGHGEQIVNNII